MLRVVRGYSRKTRVMVLNVLHYLRRTQPDKKEAEIEEATAEATGVFNRSGQRFKKELKEGKILSPSTKRRRKTPVLDTVNDSSNVACLQRIMAPFEERGEVPTTRAHLEKLKEPPVYFPGGHSSLNALLRRLGYRFVKVNTKHQTVLE